MVHYYVIFCQNQRVGNSLFSEAVSGLFGIQSETKRRPGIQSNKLIGVSWQMLEGKVIVW